MCYLFIFTMRLCVVWCIYSFKHMFFFTYFNTCSMTITYLLTLGTAHVRDSSPLLLTRERFYLKANFKCKKFNYLVVFTEKKEFKPKTFYISKMEMQIFLLILWESPPVGGLTNFFICLHMFVDNRTCWSQTNTYFYFSCAPCLKHL